MEKSDLSPSCLIPQCEELAANFLTMQQQCSYRLSKISLLVLKIADVRALCESGCNWLNLECTSRREAVNNYNLVNCDEILSLQSIETKMSSILHNRIYWLTQFANKVGRSLTALDCIYNEISDMNAEEIESEEGVLSELYKEFYVEKAKYQKLIPAPAVSQDSSLNLNNAPRRVTRSASITNNISDISHRPQSRTKLRGKQIAVPVIFEEPIDIDLVSPDDKGVKDFHDFRKPAYALRADKTSSECSQNAGSSQPSPNCHDPITLDDSENDSDEDTERPIQIRSGPTISKIFSETTNRIGKGIAEINRNRLFESSRERVDASVSSPSNDRVDSGRLIFDTNAEQPTLRNDENGIGLKELEGNKPDKSTNSSVAPSLVPLPFHGAIPLVLTSVCDENVTDLCPKLNPDLLPMHATGTLLTQVVRVPRKTPIGSSSSRCIMSRPNLSPPAENIISNKPNMRLNNHNSLMELSNKNNTQLTNLCQSSCKTSPRLFNRDIVFASASDTEASCNRSNSRKRTEIVDHLEKSKKSRLIGIGHGLTTIKTRNGISGEVATSDSDQQDQLERDTDTDIQSNQNNLPTQLPDLPSESNDCKIDLTDDS